MNNQILTSLNSLSDEDLASYNRIIFDSIMFSSNPNQEVTTMNNPETFKAWMLDKYVDEDGDMATIQDIANYGVGGGFSGLIYTNECVELYETYESEIWDALRDDAEGMGYPTVMEFVATFNRKDMLDNPDSFKNLLVWYMAERTARELTGN